MKKGKKIALFVSMFLVLAIAATLNIVLLSGNNSDGDDTQTVGSFFATSRQDRMNTRNFEISQLNDILALEGDEYATARANAAEQKEKIVAAMELELLMETLLKSQGFEDVFVAVGTASDTINIIVDKDELTQADRAKIYNIINEDGAVNTDFVSITSI